MATIHPFVYYYNDQNNIKNGNCVLISDCNIHDTIAVPLFQQRLVAHLKDQFSVAAECEALASRFTLAKTIAGTQKLHSFVVLSDTTLSVSEYSWSTACREVSVVKSTQDS